LKVTPVLGCDNEVIAESLDKDCNAMSPPFEELLHILVLPVGLRTPGVLLLSFPAT
jgi:hypothetical protein